MTQGMPSSARRAGQRLWPIVAIGKGEAKTLVAGIRVNGGPVKDSDATSWQHVKAVIANLQRQRDKRAQWDEFAAEVGCPRHVEAKTSIELARATLKACQAARSNASALSSLTSDEVTLARVTNDPTLCEAIAEQIRAAAASIRLAAAELYREQTLAKFDGDDRTSTLASQLFEEVLGKPVCCKRQGLAGLDQLAQTPRPPQRAFRRFCDDLAHDGGDLRGGRSKLGEDTGE